MSSRLFFSDTRLDAWVLFHQTYNTTSRVENAAFAKSDLTMQQHAILMAIRSINGPATPTEIAKWVERNVNSITLIVDRMENASLVRRVWDIADRRSHRIEITEKGRGVLENSTKAMRALVENMLSGLSDNEVKAFIETLEKIRKKASCVRK